MYISFKILNMKLAIKILFILSFSTIILSCEEDDSTETFADRQRKSCKSQSNSASRDAYCDCYADNLVALEITESSIQNVSIIDSLKQHCAEEHLTDSTVIVVPGDSTVTTPDNPTVDYSELYRTQCKEQSGFSDSKCDCQADLISDREITNETEFQSFLSDPQFILEYNSCQ